jgi:transcription initiation factor IIF auxiliary subunit
MSEKLDIEFKNELYNPHIGTPQVLYKKRIVRTGVRNIYRNRLYVTGHDVDKIKEVRYTLHHTFPNPVRISKNPTNGFETIIWAWGEFDIHIKVTTKNNEEHTFEHRFEFGDQLREAAKNKDIEFELK